MKKLLLAAAVASITVACNNEANHAEANDSVVTTTTPVDTLPVTETFSDYKEGDVIKKDGQLVVYTNGAWVPVEKDLVLDNGVTVKQNGEIVDKKAEPLFSKMVKGLLKQVCFLTGPGLPLKMHGMLPKEE
ncbi:hypothetical protein KRR40_03845 [Niabella defluvii]|nr:hypothetical protein KRR40_03845 [Niabella sp. I65]